jgi:hypothetical protein
MSEAVALRQELVPLDNELTKAPDGMEPSVPFHAWLDGQRVSVTAVLVRLSVIPDPSGWGDSRTIAHRRLLVAEGSLTWRSGQGSGWWTRERTRATAVDERRQRREASDARARADQERVGKEKRPTRRAPVPKPDLRLVGETAAETATLSPTPPEPAPPPPPLAPESADPELATRGQDLMDLFHDSWVLVLELEEDLAPYREVLDRLARQRGLEPAAAPPEEKPAPATTGPELIEQVIDAQRIAHDLGVELVDSRFEVRRLVRRIAAALE